MRPKPFQIVTALMAAVLILSTPMLAQQAAPPVAPAQQMLSPNQLDDLVAPIALYPDELLSQVLVASTYPLQLVQAYQFLQKNPGLTGPDLTQAAQQQNWDPSVQALVVFPDVLKRLNDDVTWTTNLGDAFMAQQQDVMDAVQRMRRKAQEAGKLQSTPQQQVTVTNQGGAPIVGIEPTNPDVIYVPVYDPAGIWGPAMWYPYPRWYWPPVASGMYFGFGPAIHVGVFFGGGWHGWSGWGWHPAWNNRTVVVNNTFVRNNRFNTHITNNVRSTTVWRHDGFDRQQIAPSRNIAPRPTPEETRRSLQAPAADRTWNREAPRNNPQPRGDFGRGMDRGYTNPAPQRMAPAPRVEAPRVEAPRMQTPRSAPSGHSFAPGGWHRR